MEYNKHITDANFLYDLVVLILSIQWLIDKFCNWQGARNVDGYVPNARWYDFHTVSLEQPENN